MKGMFLIKGMLYLKAWAAKGGGVNFDKRNVFDKGMLYLKTWAAKGGGG